MYASNQAKYYTSISPIQNIVYGHENGHENKYNIFDIVSLDGTFENTVITILNKNLANPKYSENGTSIPIEVSKDIYDVFNKYDDLIKRGIVKTLDVSKYDMWFKNNNIKSNIKGFFRLYLNDSLEIFKVQVMIGKYSIILDHIPTDEELQTIDPYGDKILTEWILNYTRPNNVKPNEFLTACEIDNRTAIRFFYNLNPYMYTFTGHPNEIFVKLRIAYQKYHVENNEMIIKSIKGIKSLENCIHENLDRYLVSGKIHRYGCHMTLLEKDGKIILTLCLKEGSTFTEQDAKRFFTDNGYESPDVVKISYIELL